MLTPLQISLPYDPRTDIKSSPPPLIECHSIWDTGATNSVVTKSLAQKIGLIPTGKEKVTNTSSVELRNSYLINIVLPNKVVIPYLKITECENVLGDGKADMLIGMDVIGRGDFAITYENDKTVMSFIMPSIDTIDYVPISNSENRKLETLEKFQVQKQARSLRQPSRKTLKARRKKERQNKKKNRRKY
ncbi:MAG: hypothetical protein Q8R11_03200 [bacterium]|nr:hypothetical protein [bacterium]